jgi:hypothetical protein
VLQNEDQPLVEYWLALPLAAIPDNSGILYSVPKILLVRNALAAVALKVFKGGNIVGCAHVIPEIATSSNTGDRHNKQWIVNSHMDLATSNDV